MRSTSYFGLCRGDADPAKTRSALAVKAGPPTLRPRSVFLRETLARLETYETLLRQWQKAVNLVAARSLEAVWQRHFADSAQLVALAPRPVVGST